MHQIEIPVNIVSESKTTDQKLIIDKENEEEIELFNSDTDALLSTQFNKFDGKFRTNNMETFINNVPIIVKTTTCSQHEISLWIRIAAQFGKFLIITVLLGAALLLILLAMYWLIIPSRKLESFYYKSTSLTNKTKDGGCDQWKILPLWTTHIPKLQSESSPRLVDVNLDGTLDVILGFGTAVDSEELLNEQQVCEIYFKGNFPCGGGVLALDGSNGAEIWRYYFYHEFYSLNCREDLTSDGIPDCVAAGRQVMVALNSRTGKALWERPNNLNDFSDTKNSDEKFINYYQPQSVGDIDNDGVLDFVQIHGGGDLNHRRKAHIIIFSGKSGNDIVNKYVPDSKESYCTPVVIQLVNNQLGILFGTGGETIHGRLYLVMLNELLASEQEHRAYKYQIVYSSNYRSGIMVPPVLIDFDFDNQPELLVSTFNGSVLVLNGLTKNVIWHFRQVSGETYATPAPAYFNDDLVPDVMIQQNIGPGYPIYYFSWVQVLNGRNGEPLTERIYSTTAVLSSPLSISLSGHGDDVFLFWQQLCKGHERDFKAFEFSSDTANGVRSRAQYCKLRFNTTTLSRFYLLSHSAQDSGIVLHDSDDVYLSEHANWELAALREATDFVHGNPRFRDQYLRYLQILKRPKRHVGPHDDEGAATLVSTPTLAPALENSDRFAITNDSNMHSSSKIDVLYATFWRRSYPAKLISDLERQCRESFRKNEIQRFSPNNMYFGMDTDQYREMYEEACSKSVNDVDSENEKPEISSPNIFNLRNGVLSFYRKQLVCVCKSTNCPKILPFEQQRWSSYLGNRGDSYFRP